jgi:hypothetical protein
MRISNLLLMLPIGVFLSAPAVVASPIFGSVDFSGTITVSNTPEAISWSLPPGNPNKALIGAASGSFAGLSGTLLTIDNLVNPPATVDAAGFANQNFISFDAAPLLPTLLINFIAQGVFNSASCTAAPAAGQTCTPNVPGGSPFSFINTSLNTSSATFVFSGVTSDGLSNWQGVFTSQFNENFQKVLQTLASTGTISNTYSATITATAVPEPNTLLLVFGAFGVLVGCIRKQRMKA